MRSRHLFRAPCGWRGCGGTLSCLATGACVCVVMSSHRCMRVCCHVQPQVRACVLSCPATGACVCVVMSGHRCVRVCCHVQPQVRACVLSCLATGACVCAYHMCMHACPAAAGALLRSRSCVRVSACMVCLLPFATWLEQACADASERAHMHVCKRTNAQAGLCCRAHAYIQACGCAAAQCITACACCVQHMAHTGASPCSTSLMRSCPPRRLSRSPPLRWQVYSSRLGGRLKTCAAVGGGGTRRIHDWGEDRWRCLRGCMFAHVCVWWEQGGAVWLDCKGQRCVEGWSG